MEKIRRRLVQLLWEETGMDPAEAEVLCQNLKPADSEKGWYWEDLDYTDQTHSYWSAAEHYHRLAGILTAFGENRLKNDSVYAEKIKGALNFWLIHDFENPNWWHNEIGMPQNIGNIALMMEPVLECSVISRAARLVRKGSMDHNKDICARWTGANLIWGMLNTIRYALLAGDESLLMAASKRAAEEITIGMEEGIQEDYSFFQHGTRLYAGGYGRSFVHDISRLLFLLQGSLYEIPEAQVDIFLSFLLDGLQHMTQCGALDWACVGRELSRVDALQAGTMVGSLEILTRIKDLPRKRELLDFYARIRGEAHPDMTKYFEKAAMLCHHFHGIYVGAKFMNSRLLGAEIWNREGMLCYNMSYGTHTCIMRNGKEYDNINAVWDYARVPGTTACPETDACILEHQDWWNKYLPNEHSGGKQNGRRAVIYELAEHDGVKALIAYFAFEDGFVCLGTEIVSPSVPVVTTVDQCLLQDMLVWESRSVIHNRIRYTGLEGTQIHAEVKTQCGSWYRNNRALSKEPVRAEVVTLTVEHEKVPGRYAYMISAADQELPRVEVLQNDRAVQAIRLPDEQILAVFHESGDVFVDNGVVM